MSIAEIGWEDQVWASGLKARRDPVESRTKKLQQLLKKLGKAVHASIVNADEVSACLRELKAHGWDAVMIMEASLVCREDGGRAVEDSSMHIHIDPATDEVRYRINSGDARLLASLGISPTRHRSSGSSRSAARQRKPDSDSAGGTRVAD